MNWIWQVRNYKIVPFLPSTIQTQVTLLNDSSPTLDGILLFSLVSGINSLFLHLSYCFSLGNSESRGWDKGLGAATLHGKSTGRQEWESKGVIQERRRHWGNGALLRWLLWAMGGWFWWDLPEVPGCLSALSIWGAGGGSTYSVAPVSCWLRIASGVVLPLHFWAMLCMDYMNSKVFWEDPEAESRISPSVP